MDRGCRPDRTSTGGTQGPLHTDTLSAERLDAAARAEIVALCTAAYGEPLPLFELLPGSVHVMARLGGAHGELVSHAAWVARRLETERLPPLHAAYVEAVATAPSHQGRGYATAVMRELAGRVAHRRYDIAALSPSHPEFYARLGWEVWRGPLAIRTGGGLLPTRGETVMVLRLPRTPSGLDLDAPLTAEWRPGELW